MPRGKIGRARPDRKTIDFEIARLRDLDVGALRPLQQFSVFRSEVRVVRNELHDL
jgi:hypothetical protein